MNQNFYVVFVMALLLAVGCEDDRIKFPKISPSTLQLNLTSEQPVTQFTLNVSSQVNIGWQVTYKPEWITLAIVSGSGQGEVVTVTAQTTNLLPQTLNDKIIFSTTTGTIEIAVKLTVTTSNAVAINPQSLDIDYDEKTRQITITNYANTSAGWEIKPSSSYLTLSPASGTLNPGQSATLTLTIDRSNLETKVYSEKLQMNVEGILYADIGVAIKNFTQDKLMLDKAVIDAEYDRNSDNLILLSDDKLYKLSPETGTTTYLDLSAAGSSLSISGDGHYAVVGQSQAIALIDLTQMKIEKVYATTADVFDVVLAPNNWVYAFPRGTTSTNIRCINLSDGAEVLSTGNQIYGGTQARLHPSGEYIYGYRNGLSPYYAEKYDIRGGQANFLYSSPYHAEYEFPDAPWITQDGLRMITESRQVFKLSSEQNEDLTFAGTLETDNNVYIQSIDHHSGRNLLCATYLDFYSNPTLNKVSTFTGNQLTQSSTKTISGFLVGSPGYSQIVAAESKFIFFNSSGTKVYVIVQGRVYFEDEKPWAVATINVD